MFEETLPNGREYLDVIKNTTLDNTGMFVVTPESYFVLGDNRDPTTAEWMSDLFHVKQLPAKSR